MKTNLFMNNITKKKSKVMKDIYFYNNNITIKKNDKDINLTVNKNTSKIEIKHLLGRLFNINTKNKINTVVNKNNKKIIF